MSTVKQITKLFGGTGKTAERYGLLPSNVSNWIKDGKVPPRWWYRIYKDMQAMGYNYDPENDKLTKIRKKRNAA